MVNVQRAAIELWMHAGGVARHERNVCNARSSRAVEK